MIDAKELLRIKDRIEESKKTYIGLNAKRETLLEQLKSKYGCDCVDDAKKLISNSEKELKKEQKRLDDTYRELTEIMESV